MASSKPQKYTRKWYLNNLCKEIYGRVKINYEKQGEEIFVLSKSGLADKCEFKSPENMAVYKQKMTMLLKYTFFAKKITFDFKIKNTPFTRELAINNALDYFNRANSIDSRKKDHFRIELSQYEALGFSIIELLDLGLSEYILDAIFGINSDDDNNKDKYVNENIKDRFESSVSAFQSELILRAICRKNDIRLDQQELYFDTTFAATSKYNKKNSISKQLGNCNYAIPLTLKETFSLPLIDKEEIIIPVGPRTAPQIDDETKNKELFKQMVSGYVHITTDTEVISNENIVYQNLHLPFVQETKHYSLSEISLFEDRQFYYLTCLDMSTLTSIFCNPQTHNDLHRIIVHRAKKHITEQNSEYKNIEEKYALSILDYFDDVLQRFADLIKYNDFILNKIPDDQTGNEMLNILGIDRHELFSKLIEYKDEQEQWQVVYICFDYAIIRFLESMIQEQTLFVFLIKHSSPSAISDHISKIKELIASFDYIPALKTEHDKNEDEMNVFSFNLGFCDKKRIPNLISKSKEILESYIAKLEESAS